MLIIRRNVVVDVLVGVMFAAPAAAAQAADASGRPCTSAAGSAVWFGLCAAVIGLVWFAFNSFRLTRAVKSLSRRLRHDGASLPKPAGCAVVKDLADAINARFDDCTDHIAKLETQNKQLQIQVRLSRRQKADTDAIIYSINDAVIVVDEFDKLLMANETASKLFGFEAESCIFKPIDQLIPSDCEEYQQLVQFISHSRQSRVRHSRREMQLPGTDCRRVFDCIVSCVFDDKTDKVSEVVAVLHDITREKEISQMKNDFVSHVSHELKTPLASITAYSEMLADGEADDEQTRKQFYSVIQSQAKRLNRLIEDILNVSRIESGLIKVNKEPVSLTILIKEQLQMMQSYAEEKNIQIVGQDQIVFDQVYADKDMISQVVVNLLSNAVKYTKAGGKVTIKTDVDEAAGIARVTVTDTGVGIPENEIDRVFDKFYRVDANKHQAKGTGLGLNLVKQIVEKVHNGRVFVNSKVSVGSTFGFELPLAAAVPQAV